MSFFCENCGTPIPDGSQFCPECGTPVPADIAPPAQETGLPLNEGSANDQPAKSSALKKVLIGVAALAVLGIGGYLFLQRMPHEVEKEDPAVIVDQPGSDGNNDDITVVQNDLDNGNNDNPILPSSDGNDTEEKEELGNPEEPVIRDDHEEPPVQEEQKTEEEETEQTHFFTNLKNDDDSDQKKDEESDSKKEVEEKSSEEEGQIFPDSSSRSLTESEIRALTDEELRYAINEVYARHGYIFKDSGLLNYYKQFPWYDPSIPNTDFKQTMFNDTEYQNVQMMQKERDSRR